MNFKKDMEIILLKKLNEINIPFDPASNFEDICERYFAVKDRIPRKQKWKTFASEDIQKTLYSSTNALKTGYKKLIRASHRGTYLQPWIHNGIYSNTNDLMLYEWGISHFHLGNNLVSNSQGVQVIERTREILYGFVNYTNSTIYLIDIYFHSGFSRQEILNSLDRNWPKLLEPYEYKNVLGVAETYSNNEIKALRKAAINCTIQLESGKVIGQIGGGITGVGTSASAQFSAMQFIKEIEKLERMYKEREPKLKLTLVESKGKVFVKNGSFLINDFLTLH